MKALTDFDAERASLRTRSLSSARQEARARRLRAPPVGESLSVPADPSLFTDFGRLLGVYNKLKGIAAATNTEEVQNDLMSQARGLIDDITNDHVSAVKTFIKNQELQASLDQEIRDECQELVEYIVAARRFNLEVNARSKDRCISFGEKLSCRFMAALLKDLVRKLPISAS